MYKKIFQHNSSTFFEELDKFIKSNPIGTKNFRYFSSRPYAIIENHIYTCLYYIHNICVGYGHLDLEKNKTWLGIIVSDSKVNEKLGNQIMDDLIHNSKNDIHLSVDIDNIRAIKLYEKKGFKIMDQKNTYYLMKLKKQ